MSVKFLNCFFLNKLDKEWTFNLIILRPVRSLHSRTYKIWDTQKHGISTHIERNCENDKTGEYLGGTRKVLINDAMNTAAGTRLMYDRAHMSSASWINI